MPSLLAQAQAAIAAKNWQAAEPLLLQALTDSPDSHELLFLHGQTSLKLGKYVAAEHSLLAALALQPDDPATLFYLSLCALAAGQPREAVVRLERYLALAPEDADGWKQLGMAHSVTKAHAAALAAFEKAVEFAPQDLASLRHCYRLHFLLGQDDDCRNAYHQALVAENLAPDARQLVFARIVSTETWELLANNWVKLHLPSEPAGATRIRPSLTRHDRARLLTPEWLVLTANNDVLIEQMTHNPATLPTKGLHVPALGQERCLIDLPRTPDRVIDDACILVGGSPHYYHWLVDYLPRIGVAHKVPALRDLKLLVNESLTEWQWASLAALGIAREQVLPVPANALVQCRALWVPTLLSHVASAHSYVAGWLRRRLLTREMKARPARRLFIRSADDTTAGQLANADELMACLTNMGFESVVPEQMDFMAQVELFSVAERIVSPALPSLANLLFAPAGARVVEIQSAANPATFFQTMSQSIGLRYQRYVAAPDAERPALLHPDPTELMQLLTAHDGVAH